ncbi:MAG: polyprenyl synthetase family protein [Deltaproteobacteria bacterium]|nr:polyprenyl synthetase family protein [Deltaproteobacteria bacterium]
MKFPAAAALDATALAELLDADFSEWPELGENGTELGVPTELWEKALLGPAREFLSRPGKEFRARLVHSAWSLAGGEGDQMPAQLPLLVEIIHAGSLIIDDIQDQSESRRGAETLHKLYGTAVAINTGNWLYYWPFVLIGRLGLEPTVQLDLYQQASLTMLRCHQGQALDLSARVFELGARDLPGVVAATTRLKTGSLMEFAARLGASAAGGDRKTTALLSKFGRELGCALQMLDDVGGLMAKSRRAKGNEDLRLARPTWPWSWLAEDADEVTFAKLHGDARAVFDGSDPELVAAPLRELLGQSGPAKVKHHLQRALAGLEEEFPGAPALTSIHREVSRLERSYV